MLLLLEDDLDTLSRAKVRSTAARSGDGYVCYLESPYDKVYDYWMYQLLSNVVARMANRLKDNELLAIVAIAKRVAELGQECKRLSGHDIAAIICTIECAHVARFERKLLHARANPQFLLEAKAELREKKTLAKAKSAE